MWGTGRASGAAPGVSRCRAGVVCVPPPVKALPGACVEEGWCPGTCRAAGGGGGAGGDRGGLVADLRGILKGANLVRDF